MASLQKNQKKEDEVREYVSCFVKILPPHVKSYEDFIKHIAINIFPMEILPIRVNKNGKIKLKDDQSTIDIIETNNTIKCIEFKSYQYKDRQTNYSNTKYCVSFRVPIPRKSDPFYDYMMTELVNPLLHPYDDDDEYSSEKDDDKVPMTRITWVYRAREYYTIISLADDDDEYVIPCQNRFRNMSTQDE